MSDIEFREFDLELTYDPAENSVLIEGNQATLLELAEVIQVLAQEERQGKMYEYFKTSGLISEVDVLRIKSRSETDSRTRRAEYFAGLPQLSSEEISQEAYSEVIPLLEVAGLVPSEEPLLTALKQLKSGDPIRGIKTLYDGGRMDLKEASHIITLLNKCLNRFVS